MTAERSASSGLLDAAERLLGSTATKLGLSFLIVLSILPASASASVLPQWLAARLDLAFASIFAPEFLLRLVVFVGRSRRARAARGWEAALLAADLLALASFLPLHDGFPNTAYFRLFRLTRLLLLLGYWGDMMADLWRILAGSDRRFQVVLVVLLGLVLSFAGAAVVGEFAPAYDYNVDDRIDGEDHSFLHVLWWSFRQVQDPGNLATKPVNALVVGVSLVLTFAGLLLLSFVIGISTGAMDELMRRSQERPVGLRGHTVILGLGDYTRFLLEELADINRKNRKRARVAVLGSAPGPPAYLLDRRLRGFRYRKGDPVRVADLDRVDVEDAERILVLGTGSDEPDARVISAILAARGCNRRAVLYADLEHEKNFVAARAAGGSRTRVVGSGPFLGYYAAQNVLYPGVARAYRDLLTTAGCEIYTYFFDAPESRRLLALQGERLDSLALFERGWLNHRVSVLGFFVQQGDSHGEPDEAAVILNPLSASTRRRFEWAFDVDGRLRTAGLRGLVGVAERWEDLSLLAGSLSKSQLPVPAPAQSDGPAFELQLPAGRAGRVIICGAGARVPRVVSELARACAPLEVTLLVRESGQVPTLERSIESALSGFLSGRPSAAAAGVQLHVLQAEWTDATTLLRDPAVALERTDAMLFLPEDPGDVSDGRVALDCLRLAEFASTGLVRFRPGFRVVAMMRDPVKSDLLEARLDQIAGPGNETRFTIVSSERLRNHFLVQNLFVPGLSAVLLDMLETSGQHLCRLLPASLGGAGRPSGDVDAWELARHLLVARGLVPVGIESVNPSGRTQTILDPGQLAPGRRVAWSSVSALYVLGEAAPRASQT